MTARCLHFSPYTCSILTEHFSGLRKSVTGKIITGVSTMGRPGTKDVLLTAAADNYGKMNAVIQPLTPPELAVRNKVQILNIFVL